VFNEIERFLIKSANLIYPSPAEIAYNFQ